MVGVVVVTAFIVIAVGLWVWSQSRTKCPHCGSYKVVKIDQVVDKVTQLDQFHDEGAGTRLQMEISETFRCVECAKVWTQERTET